MFDIVTKSELWEWIDKGVCSTKFLGLKQIQDAYIISEINGSRGLKIGEMGGGNSRVLNALKNTNECWNIDKFEGQGGGPTTNVESEGIRLVKAFIGEFNEELPNAYFDVLFSVSVFEHIPLNQLEKTFVDCARIIKPGGKMIHAIDVYLYDHDEDPKFPGLAFTRERIEHYLSFANRPDLGLRLRQSAKVSSSATASARYISNPDSVLYEWNKVVPSIKGWRARAQSTSLKAVWVKD